MRPLRASGRAGRSVAPALLLAASLGAPASASEARSSLVAALPLSYKNAPIPEADQRLLNGAILSVSGEFLGQRGYTVLDDKTTLQVLEDNGITAEQACDTKCALQTARDLKAGHVVAGSVFLNDDSTFTLMLRLSEQGGAQLGQATIDGASIQELVRRFREGAESFFRKVPVYERFVVVPFSSEPPGASVKVDGATACAQTPCTVKLKPGRHEVLFEMAGRIAVKRQQVLDATSKAEAVLRVASGRLGGGRFEVTPEVATDKRTRRTWQRFATERTYDFESAERYCEGLLLEGKRGWRLPARPELLTLARAGVVPAVDPEVFGAHADQPFWTATRVGAKRAAVMRLDDGSLRTESHETALPVRCVRHAPDAPLQIEGRTARARRLVWRREAGAAATFDEAKEGCGRPVEGEGLQGDWRLPTRGELQTLLDDAFEPRIDAGAFGEPEHPIFWATVAGDSDKAFTVDFRSGESAEGDGRGRHAWRCVRTETWGVEGPLRFAARLGAGTHNGVVGLNVEAELFTVLLPGLGRRSVRAGVGSGTHLVSGGLSLGPPDGATGWYVDAHAAWQRTGVLGGKMKPGLGTGVSAGIDFRFVPWLSVKAGLGLAWSSANAGKVRPLVLDLAVGPVF